MAKFQAQIEWRNPRELQPYALNNKQHPQSQIEKIAASIREFGFDAPIVVDGRGVIIKGHGRREAALLLELAKIPVLVRTDLSPAQVKAARLADNRVAESPFDYAAIAAEIQQLDELDFDLTLTGFDPAEIDKFLEGSQIDYQAPQVLGGDPVLGGGVGSGEGEAGDKDPDEARYDIPDAKFPLAIVLNAAQMKAWKAYKESISKSKDTDAFLIILQQL